MERSAPNIRAVSPKNGRRLLVTWKGGAESIIDVSRHIKNFAAFAPLLDDARLFRRLQRSDMASIVSIQLDHLRKLLADRKIGLELDRSALEWLAAEGYDSTYGARPLKRVIQRSLQNPLASLILEGAVRDGDTVHVSAGPQGLTINGQLAEAA